MHLRSAWKDSPVSPGISLASGDGRFVAVNGSEGSVLLEALVTILKAGRYPAHSPGIPELPFELVVLGEKQSRRLAGGFSGTPPGDWIATKIFFGKGDAEEGEVFLNLNPILGKTEFSMKDPEYGDYLLEQFAKVL